MARLNKLFERTKIGRIELKNRLCFEELGMPADEESYVTQQTMDFYVERARGDVFPNDRNVATRDNVIKE